MIEIGGRSVGETKGNPHADGSASRDFGSPAGRKLCSCKSHTNTQKVPDTKSEISCHLKVRLLHQGSKLIVLSRFPSHTTLRTCRSTPSTGESERAGGRVVPFVKKRDLNPLLDPGLHLYVTRKQVHDLESEVGSAKRKNKDVEPRSDYYICHIFQSKHFRCVSSTA